jgi:hypothetical protein
LLLIIIIKKQSNEVSRGDPKVINSPPEADVAFIIAPFEDIKDRVYVEIVITVEVATLVLEAESPSRSAQGLISEALWEVGCAHLLHVSLVDPLKLQLQLPTAARS